MTHTKPMPILYCPACQLEFDTRHLHDLETCPACGGELDERPRESQCAHEWGPSEPDEDGWRVHRCVKCGEFE